MPSAPRPPARKKDRWRRIAQLFMPDGNGMSSRASRLLRRIGVFRIADRHDLSREAEAGGALWWLDKEREHFVAELPRARLLGPVPLALTADGTVIEDTYAATPARKHGRADVAVARAIHWHGPRHTIGALRRGADGETPERIERACVLGRRKSYYHWLLDELPKLQGVELYTERTGETPTLVVPARLPSWVGELLELAGHGDGPRLEWARGDARVERLVVPSHQAKSPEVCRWLRGRLNPAAKRAGGKPPPGTTRRILISREDADVRRVLNHSELEDALAELGFCTVVTSGLRVADEVALFADAEAIVGAHGAGLTNLIYAEHAAVVELFGSKQQNTFRSLATRLGFPYQAVVGKPEGDDLTVDVEEVSETIGGLLEGRATVGRAS